MSKRVISQEGRGGEGGGGSSIFHKQVMNVRKVTYQ